MIKKPSVSKKGAPMSNTASPTPKKVFLSGNALKMIAIITMLIDHVTAVTVENHILPDIVKSYIGATDTIYTQKDYMFWINVDTIGRGIGRLAFPIFVFLLVEGFYHTSSVLKYAFRLLIFALISEIPFDMAIYGTYFNFEYQNVYFTLFLSLLMMWGFDYVSENVQNKALKIFLMTLIFLTASFVSICIKCDYNIMGIAIAASIYLLRQKPRFMWIGVTFAMLLTMGIVGSSVLELAGVLSFILIARYNGERGSFNLKYLFYAFYPLHLFVLGILNIFVLK